MDVLLSKSEQNLSPKKIENDILRYIWMLEKQTYKKNICAEF